LRDAARVPLFWILFAAFFICGASTAGLIQTHEELIRCPPLSRAVNEPQPADEILRTAAFDLTSRGK
jgi:hypothetical protein